jgi:hypothetical protein
MLLRRLLDVSKRDDPFEETEGEFFLWISWDYKQEI